MRGKSPYLFFLDEFRASLPPTLRKDVCLVAREGAQEWIRLSPEEKEEYCKMARENMLENTEEQARTEGSI